MPAREDFGKMAARLLTDPRTHRAAELYVEAGLAPEASAVALVCAHVAMLGLRLQLDRGSGRIPGDGVAFVAVACMTTPTTARKVLGALSANAVGEDHAYLVAEQDGLRLAGFEGQYGALMERRAAAAGRARRSRGAPERPAQRARDIGECHANRPPKPGAADPADSADSRDDAGSHANGARDDGDRHANRERDPRADQSRENPPPTPPAGGNGVESPLARQDSDDDSTAPTPPPWEAVATALLARHGLDLGKRPYRGGVSEKVWRQHAEALLADGLDPDRVAEAIARAPRRAKPWEAFRALRAGIRDPAPPPRPRNLTADEAAREEALRDALEVMRPHLEAAGVDLNRKGDGVRAWAAAVKEALAGGVFPDAVAKAVAVAPDWMRPREALRGLLAPAQVPAAAESP